MNRWLLLATIMACLGAAACGESSQATKTASPAPSSSAIQIAQGDDIVVGVSAALSGDQAVLGQDLADAVDLAIEEYGQTIAGHSVSSVRADDGCDDAEMASSAAERLASSAGLVGVIGPMCTTGAQAANDLYEDAGVVHITPSATRDSLSAQGEHLFFRTVWRDERQAEVQAAYAIEELDSDSAVVIDDGDPYGKTLADAFVPAFESGGGTVIARERIERGVTSFDTFARQVLTGDPDLVVFQGLDPEGALLLRDLREAGYDGDFIGPDSLFNARDFVGTGGEATEAAVLTAGPVADQAFVDRFQARFGRVPATSFVLQAYDATRALLEAVAEIAGEEAGSLSLDPSALAAALRERSATGLTGTVAFDENGDRAGTSPREAGLAIYRVTNGAFEQVE
jgi:branched-chain amino acid transport system substrate-binding protein